jgi:hypothetical protein
VGGLRGGGSGGSSGGLPLNSGSDDRPSLDMGRQLSASRPIGGGDGTVSDDDMGVSPLPSIAVAPGVVLDKVSSLLRILDPGHWIPVHNF